MSERDPLQVVLILDATAAVATQDVLAVLPDYEQAPRVCRLSNYPHNARSDWDQQSRVVTRLAREVKSLQAAEADIELYVTGQAPLPLFVLLGHELRDWKHRLIFLDQRGDKKSWDLFDLAAPGSLEKEPFDTPLFDHVHWPSAPGSLRADRPVDVFVSSRGAPLNRALLARFHDQSAANHPALIEIRSNHFLPLTPANVNQAAEELRRYFRRFLHEIDVNLFLYGPAVLAFAIGRALDINLHHAVVPLFERNEFRPALRFPVEERIAPPQHLTVGVIYAFSAEDTANKLLIHLRVAQRGSNILLDIVDFAKDIPPGDNRETARHRLLTKCDLLVPLLNAEYFAEDLPDLLRAYRSADRREAPLLESYVSLPNDFSQRILLPRDRVPLRSQPNLDKALTEVVTEIVKLGSELLQQRRQQEALSSSRRIPDVQTLPTTVAECLDSISRDLDQLPRLRYTEDDRYRIWERLVEFLDGRHPEKNITSQLRAPSRDQVAKQRKYAPNSPEPSLFLPEEPLQLILSLVQPEDAERWLYLGAMEVNPRLKFPRWHGTQQDLTERLSSYSRRSDWKEWAAQSAYLFEHDCQSLRATMSRQHPESFDEIRHAVRLLKEFRSGEPFTADLLTDLSQVRFVGLLTVIGAQALFRGNLPLAESAYRAARQRARVDENELAEWVSVRGLLSAIRCQTPPDASAHRVQSQEETDCEQRRDQLEQTPFVIHLRDQLQATQLHTQSSLIDRLQSDADRERMTVHVGSSAWSLDILLHDQEDLGELPMRGGETATLIGQICLLLSEVRNLPYAIELLCRYGVKNNDGKDFYSEALNASLPDWEKIVRTAFREGRTHGERLARLEFFKRHLTEIPPELVPTAWTFYLQLLDHYLPLAEGACQRVKGGSYVSTEGATILEDIVDQATTLAGYSKQGSKLLLSVLHREHPLCWQLVLSRFHRHAWERWVSLGELPQETLNSLVHRVIELLDSDEGRALFSPSKRWRSRWFWVNHIPIGIARFLDVLQQSSQVPKSLVEQLHRQLCRLLEQGVASDPNFYSRTFCAHSITKWLRSRKDPQTLHFIERHVDSMLTKIEQSKPPLADFETWAALGECLFLLRSSDWTRLHILVERDRDGLYSELASKRESLGLLWLAAALINQDQIPVLQDTGRQLLRNGIEYSAGLAAAVAANPDRIQSDRPALERAVLSSVRHRENLPWSGTRYGAIHNFVFFHWKTEPLCGWSRWLQPVLTQLYTGAKQPHDTISALGTVDLALKRIPASVDPRTTLQALCWLIGQARGPVRDEALYVAVHHRSLFDQVDKDMLDEALAPFDLPPTLSIEWSLRQASIPPDGESP